MVNRIRPPLSILCNIPNTSLDRHTWKAPYNLAGQRSPCSNLDIEFVMPNVSPHLDIEFVMPFSFYVGMCHSVKEFTMRQVFVHCLWSLMITSNHNYPALRSDLYMIYKHATGCMPSINTCDNAGPRSCNDVPLEGISYNPVQQNSWHYCHSTHRGLSQCCNETNTSTSNWWNSHCTLG